MSDQFNEYECLLDNALDAIVGMNSDEQIIFWNQQAEKVFGWKKEEVLGKSVSQMIIPLRFREEHLICLKLAVETGIGPRLNQRTEVIALKQNGDEFSAELSITPVKNNFYAFVRDLTELKNKESGFNEDIHQRDDLISICSHELKTPLTSLILQYQLAEKQLKNKHPKALCEETTKKRIETTNRQLLRLSRLIEEMLDLSRINLSQLHISKEKVNLSQLVTEVSERFKLLKKCSDFEVDTEENIFIDGDPGKMDQVVSNLIANAFKYGDEKPIKVQLKSANNMAVITVQDHGPGIAPENHERIFKKFERVTSSTKIKGLGVGLFVTKHIVNAHGGKIKVESDLGQGALFSVIMDLKKASNSSNLKPV